LFDKVYIYCYLSTHWTELVRIDSLRVGSQSLALSPSWHKKSCNVRTIGSGIPKEKGGGHENLCLWVWTSCCPRKDVETWAPQETSGEEARSQRFPFREMPYLFDLVQHRGIRSLSLLPGKASAHLRGSTHLSPSAVAIDRQKKHCLGCSKR
jgi:hypothetical protein